MNISWKSCFRVGISAFILFLLIHFCDAGIVFLGRVLGAVTPILLGFVVAYILNILMSFYERHYFNRWAKKEFVQKTRRVGSMIFAIVTLVGIVSLVVRLVIPELVSCVKFLIAEIPPTMEKVLRNQFVVEVIPAAMLSKLSTIDWQNSISTIVRVITSGLGSTVSTIYIAVSSVFSWMVTLFISVIFSIYLLLGKEKLMAQGNRLLDTYMPSKWVKKLRYLLTVLNDSFHRYIVGQCTEAVILGVLCILGMLILRIPYAPMVGTLIGFTALIPVAGAYIGAGVGAIMIFTVSPVQALVFLIFILVIQQIEGNLIYPKVVGNSIGLPAIWVLATVTIGGSLTGISGMLIGVPLAAVIYRLVKEDVLKREQAKLDVQTDVTEECEATEECEETEV